MENKCTVKVMKRPGCVPSFGITKQNQIDRPVQFPKNVVRPQTNTTVPHMVRLCMARISTEQSAHSPNLWQTVVSTVNNLVTDCPFGIITALRLSSA